MKMIPVREIHKLLTAGAVSVLLSSSAALAGDKATAEQPGQSDFTAHPFEHIDNDNSGALSWSELQSNYSQELSNAGITENNLLERYDQNQNSELEQDEYSFFITGLAIDSTEQASASLDGDQAESRDTSEESSASYTQQDAAAPIPEEIEEPVSQSASELSAEQHTWGEEETSADGERAPVVSGGLVDAGAGASSSGADDTTAEVQQQASANTEANPANNVKVYEEPAVAVGPQFDVEAIKDRSVINSQGQQLGEVKDVVVRADGSEAGLVVDLDKGTAAAKKDVFVSINEVSASGDQIVWEQAPDPQSLQELPDYDEADFMSISEAGV